MTPEQKEQLKEIKKLKKIWEEIDKLLAKGFKIFDNLPLKK